MTESCDKAGTEDFQSARHTRARNVQAAIMDAMRESWTDDRLDDLNGKVDAFRLEARTEFKAVRADMKDEFAAVRAEMKEGFDKVDERFDRVEHRFEKMEDRFAALNRTLLQMAAGVIGTLIVASAGVIATQL
jgi:tetrahydromethanopterin S-methyltransferase subunit G